MDRHLQKKLHNEIEKPLKPHEQHLIDSLNNGRIEALIVPNVNRSRSINHSNKSIINLIPHVTNINSLQLLLQNPEITNDVFNMLLFDAFDKKNDVLLKQMLLDEKMSSVDKKLLNDEFKKRPYEMALLLK